MTDKEPELTLISDERLFFSLNIPTDSRHYKYAKEQLAWARVGAEAQLEHDINTQKASP